MPAGSNWGEHYQILQIQSSVPDDERKHRPKHVEPTWNNKLMYIVHHGLDGPGIESRWGRNFCALPDRPWGPPSLLYNGYRVFPGGKVRPGRAADHSPLSRSWKSTAIALPPPPLGHNRACNGVTLPLYSASCWLFS